MAGNLFNLFNLFTQFPKGQNDKGSSKDKFQFSSVVINWLSAGVLAAGVIIVLIFGNSLSGKATILVWMLACLLAGVFIGFLFGIPKILQSSGNPPPPAPAPAPNAAQPGGGAPPPPPPGNTAAAVGFSYQQQVNTNLTEISDWLTKIIVGLGLVNLKQIPPFLRSTATILAQALGKPAGTKGATDAQRAARSGDRFSHQQSPGDNPRSIADPSDPKLQRDATEDALRPPSDI